MFHLGRLIASLTALAIAMGPSYVFAQAGQEASMSNSQTDISLLRQTIQFKFDSLEGLNQSKGYTDYLSAFSKQLDTLRSKLKPSFIDSIKTKLHSLEANINRPLSKVKNPVDEKMRLYSDNGATGLPTALPRMTELPREGQTLVPNLIEKGFELPGIEMPTLKDIGGSHVTGKVDQVSSVADDLEDYQEEAVELTQGNLTRLKKLPDEVEKQIERNEEVAALDKELSGVDAANDKMERYYDPMVAKERALNKAKGLAVNHFAGHETELKAAMQQLTKLKQNLPDAEGTLDLFAKTQDTYRKKHFYERLTPAITIQVQKPNTLWLDFNPSLFCAITARWSAGAGWNERIAYNFKDHDWRPYERIYGPRGSVQFRIKPRLIVLSDTEIMNAQVRNPLYGPKADPIAREWVWSYFAGIKREFQFSDRLKGNVQIMYDFVDPRYDSPYATRINMRMGLEMPLRKGDKKPRRAEQDQN